MAMISLRCVEMWRDSDQQPRSLWR